MTKLRDPERHLRAHGCQWLREGAEQSIRHDPVSDHRTSVPRQTAPAICPQLAAPDVA